MTKFNSFKLDFYFVILVNMSTLENAKTSTNVNKMMYDNQIEIAYIMFNQKQSKGINFILFDVVLCLDVRQQLILFYLTLYCAFRQQFSKLWTLVLTNVIWRLTNSENS